LNIDSSLAARQELAAELHYTGSTDDSAAMSIWLHSAVMKKLAEKWWEGSCGFAELESLCSGKNPALLRTVFTV